MPLSGTIIISGGHFQWSSIFKGTAVRNWGSALGAIGPPSMKKLALFKVKWKSKYSYVDMNGASVLALFFEILL